jgi:hypothetical protein
MEALKNNRRHDGFTIEKNRIYTRSGVSGKLFAATLKLIAFLGFVLMIASLSHVASHDVAGSLVSVPHKMMAATGLTLMRNPDQGAKTQLKVELDKFRALFKGTTIEPSQSFIRDDVALSGTTVGQIPWTVTAIQTQTNPTVNAVRLNNNDAFLLTKIGVFISDTPTTGGAESTTQQNSSTLFTYANSLVFLGAGDAAAVQQLYNGWVYFKEESRVWFEKIRAYEFHRVGTAQQGTLLFTASNQLRSTWDDPKYGMLTVSTPFRMTGKRSYNISLNLQNVTATFAALSGTNGKLYATLILDGFLAVGGEQKVSQNEGLYNSQRS